MKIRKAPTIISEEVRDNLIELTMTYLLEWPDNFDTYAKKFFRRMKQSRHTKIEQYESMSLSDESSILTSMSSDTIPTVASVRRAVVFGESYDPNADTEEFVKPVHPKTAEERKTLERVAKQTLIFRALDEEQMEDVINAMFKRKTKPGDVIIKQFDDGDNFYVIEYGYYDVFIAQKRGEEPEHIFTYENCGNFGELALLYNQPRAATVVAKSSGIIWALDRKTFRKLVMQSAHEKRQMYEKFIKTVPLMSKVGSYEKLNVADVLVPKKFNKGDLIIRQGDETEGMYFIQTGSVSMRVTNLEGREAEIDKLGKAECFGVIELLNNTPNIASIYAEEDTKLAFLDAEAFERLLGPYKDIIKMTVKEYEGKIKEFFDDGHNSTSSSDSIPMARPTGRRGVVFGESYDPNADTEEFIKPIHPKTEEERKTLEMVSRKCLLFRALDEEQLEDVINAMFKRDTEPGDVIIKQFDDGDNFYVIESGYYDVFIAKNPGDEPKHIFQYENSGNFGELALLYNQPRAATVIAKTKGIIWALDRHTFRKLVMQSAHEKRQMYEQFIKTVPLMEQVGSYERLNIADVLVPKKYKPDDLIIQQGDEADGMYFVEKGSVCIKLKNEEGREEELVQIDEGGYFGELALVYKRPRIASAYAKEDTRLAFLDTEAFERFMGPCMDVIKRNIDHYKEQISKIFGSAHKFL